MLSQNELYQIVVATVVALCAAIRSESLAADDDVLEFVARLAGNDRAARSVGVTIANCVCHHVVGLLNGLVSSFAMERYRFPSLAPSVATSNRGVYIDVLLKTDLRNVVQQFWLYVGSSWGSSGVQNRVWNGHQNARFRANNPSYHYFIIDVLKAQPNFVLLVNFDFEAELGIVLLAEAAMALIFGSWQTLAYLAIRDPRLPHVDKQVCVNRLDPLISKCPFRKLAAIHGAQRAILLSKGMDGGTFRITKQVRGNFTAHLFCISSLSMYIPMDAVRRMRLSPGVLVHVQFNLEDGNPHKFASLAIPSDDASKLSIMIHHEYEGTMYSEHLVKQAPSAVAEANALHDWLTGRLGDIDKMSEADWGSDRFPFCGRYHHAVSSSSWNVVFADPTARHKAVLAGNPPTCAWEMRPSRTVPDLEDEGVRRKRPAAGQFLRPCDPGFDWKIHGTWDGPYVRSLMVGLPAGKEWWASNGNTDDIPDER